jgi:uncharacterized protein YjiS (DUF1127 family)
MHTISHSGASESVLTRVFLLMWSIGELAVAVAVHAVLKLMVWQERARERRRLATLDDHMLRDIGLSRSQVEYEISKPFWQA